MVFKYVGPDHRRYRHNWKGWRRSGRDGETVLLVLRRFISPGSERYKGMEEEDQESPNSLIYGAGFSIGRGEKPCCGAT